MKIETVSIIISTRNRAHYLPRALDSILAQSYSDYAVYIIDDASTDNTWNILEGYKVKFSACTILRNDLPQGTTVNARRLIEISKGAYIARLDDDDLWLPEKLQKQMMFFEQNPDTALLGTAIRGITHDNTLLAPKVNACSNEEIHDTLLQVNQFAQSSVIFRKNTYMSAGGYDTDFVTEDYELWLRMGASRVKLANLRDILTYIGVTEGQMTQKKRRQLILSEIRATWRHRKSYSGFSRAIIKRLGAFILPPKLSRIIGGYLRKYTTF